MKMRLKPGVRLVLTALLFPLVIGCSTFRTCGTVLNKEDYYSSPHYKAVAMVFDRETQRPPKNLGPIDNECWYDYEANSQQEANAIVLDGCEANLTELGKAAAWSCVLIAQGDSLTEAEQKRVESWERLGRRTPNEDSPMLTGPQGQGQYDPDRGIKQ